MFSVRIRDKPPNYLNAICAVNRAVIHRTNLASSFKYGAKALVDEQMLCKHQVENSSFSGSTGVLDTWTENGSWLASS